MLVLGLNVQCVVENMVGLFLFVNHPVILVVPGAVSLSRENGKC